MEVNSQLLRAPDARRSPWRRILTHGYSVTRRLADRAGVQLVRKRYTSPVPVLEDLPPGFWGRRSPMRGVRFDAEEQMRFAEEALAPHMREFEPPLEPTGEPDRYYAHNEWYKPVDAQVMYAMLRHFRPARVVELGSGFSSMVIGAAGERSRRDGRPFVHTMVDPFPSAALSADFQRARTVVAKGAEDVGLELFTALEAGDALVVDTSHTVRIGGDVIWIVNEILPALRPGVIVHFHDIFLPWHYPREWFEEHAWYWAEQYLLQAFLAFNSAFEVLISSQLLARTLPERLARVATMYRVAESVQEFESLWLRRTDDAAASR